MLAEELMPAMKVGSALRYMVVLAPMVVQLFNPPPRDTT